MSLVDAFQSAMEAVWLNRLRSMLTMLGMVIGVASVILLLAFGQGAVKGVEEEIKGLGTNLVFISPGSGEGGPGAAAAAGSAQTLTLGDSNALATAGLPGVVAVAPQLAAGGQLIGNAANVRVSVIGTTADYPSVRNSTFESGAFFTDRDVARSALRIVLGSEAAKKLFPDGGAVGSTVRLAFAGDVSFAFTVTGVLTSQGGGGDTAFVPVSALQSRVGGLSRNSAGQIFVNQISVQTDPAVSQAEVKSTLEGYLASRHRVSTPDFTVETQDDLLSTVRLISSILTLLLWSIAGISLVVGGIGVMNIMLVSVTQRTREIGVRLAVGATSGDIVRQFIAEALFITVVGGVIGILLGAVPALLLNGLSVGEVTIATRVEVWTIVLAFSVAVAIGLLSGLYPAWRASKLDPITALRAE